MTRLQRILKWCALAGIAGLMVLAAGSTFFGAERAGEFFNSRPPAVCWCVMLAALVAGFVGFRSLRRRPAPAAMHAGCILILAGSLWGSAGGHALRSALGGRHKIHKGYMEIYQGRSDCVVAGANARTFDALDFDVKLERFSVEYFDGARPQWRLACLRAHV
ncbi:MAG: cytochrome c biogenesis protein ResB, partial [Planctomycetes bacterium]|nr:cytochrome c biogenesis protein ResB [Planctomycetota bacterium]